jgi:hypothetical protein
VITLAASAENSPQWLDPTTQNAGIRAAIRSCRRVLRNCHEALSAGGVLLITETVLNNDGSVNPFALFMSLHLLLACAPGAKERTESEYRRRPADTRFRMEKLVRMNALGDLLIIRKI